ncbi:MAG TPA: type IV pilus secretin PilQ [Thermoanaerobaculia bacterium]|nr:type IV pilus secretin PilQ [Thermoanaerobaculia bacterium]
MSRKSAEWRRLTAAAVPLLLGSVGIAVAVGCTSSKPARVVEARPAPEQAPAESGEQTRPAVETKAPAAPAEIRSLELREGAPEVFVDIEASAPLVWTSFRNPEGKVIVELPNTVPAPRVQDVNPEEGLVSSVKVQRQSEGSRPMTQLIISTRHEVEHSVTAEGSHLQIRLLPLEAQAGAVHPAGGEAVKQKLAFEPASPTPAPAQPAAAPAAPAAPAPQAPQTRAAAPSAPAATPLAPPATPATTASPTAAGTPDEPAVAPAPQGSPATRLEAIQVVAAEPGGGAVVRISGDGEFPYATFVLREPQRFVIDLQGVVNRAPHPTVAVASAVVERVRVAQFKPPPKPVARVVFDLKQGVAPRIERTAQALVVSFGPPPAAAAGVDRSERVSQQARGGSSSKSAAGSGSPAPRAVLALAPPAQPAAGSAAAPAPPAQPAAGSAAAPAPPSDLSLKPAGGKRAAGIEVEEAAAAPAARKTPAKRADSGLPKVAGGTGLQPSADLGARQKGTVEVKRAGETFVTQEMSQQEHVYTGEPIDLKVNNADVTEVLRSFAQISGLNIIIQPGVGGSVTAEMENVPWDQAFEEVLKINNLGYEQEGNVVRIAPSAVLKQEAQDRQALVQARALVLPLRTVMRRLSYASAANVAALLRSGGSGLLTQRGSVIVDDRTNTLIIKELPTYLDSVLAVLDNLDTPEPQVMIEAKIVETTKNFSRSLGINWGFNAVSDAAHGNTTGLIFPNNGTVSGRVGLDKTPNGSINLKLGNVLNTFTLDLALQAAENEGLVSILSAPKVATLNNQQAFVQSGVQIPVQTVANGTITVQFVNATLRLEVTPQVTAEGTIMMEINISKKEPQPGFLVVGATTVPISTKDAHTRLFVRDGGTAVIGGIYKVTSNNNENRVPGLANIPIVGHLFKSKSREEDNDELLIFITPRVIKL